MENLSAKDGPRENHCPSLGSTTSATPIGGLWVRPCVVPCLAGGPSPDILAPTSLALPWAGVTSRAPCACTSFFSMQTLGGADIERRGSLPPVRSRCILSFTSPSPNRPGRERERKAQVDRWLGRIARAASSWVTQAARCFGCRTESSSRTTTEAQATRLRLLRSRRLVVSQVAMLAHRHLPLACTLSSQA